MVSFSEDVYFTFRPGAVFTVRAEIPEQGFFDSSRDSVYAYLRANVTESVDGARTIDFVAVDAAGNNKR